MTLLTDAATGPSPYERALGSSLHDLHPRLRTYFAAIPPGHVGSGRGTFETVGTPRCVLWPILAVLGRLDDTSNRQHVRVTVDMPMIGRLYEYSGSFTYEIRPEAVA